MYLWISDDFILKNGSICVWSNVYNNYKHLALAKMACSHDNQCAGIYEEICDISGTYQLCKHGFVTPDVPVFSCIYKKKEYNGKYAMKTISRYF